MPHARCISHCTRTIHPPKTLALRRKSNKRKWRMLPFQLRIPRKRRSASNNSQTDQHEDDDDSAGGGGGSIQRAIQKDLEALQQQFLTDLAKTHGDTTTDAPATQQIHWKQGQAFGIFKQSFATFKAALVHFLIPSSKCDEEAYSQLIYAACLNVLKQSSMNLPSSLDKVIAAVFALYTLHQTNPLPSSLDSPWQNLPIGLHSLENPRALYRRAFSQKIRIDPFYYSILLRLRELALACQADCHHHFYHSTPPQQQPQVSSWKCTCGLARDGLEILARLEPNLDFCDYTGPVGLEALAGHAEWQDQGDPKMARKEQPPPFLEDPPLEYPNNALKTCLETYQSKIQAIRLPNDKTPLTSRLRKAMVPFYDSNRKEPWGQVQHRLFREQTHHPPNTIANQSLTLLESQRVLPVNSNQTTVQPQAPDKAGTTTPQDSTNIQEKEKPCFELVVKDDDDIPLDMQNHIKKAIAALLEQDRDLQTELVAANHPPMMEDPGKAEKRALDTDEVSSIGIGGISVATGQGRAALQTLLSTAAGSDDKLPRVAAIPKKSSQIHNRPLTARTKTTTPSAALFFSFDQELSSDEKNNDDNDDASDVSNLSFEEEEEDVDNDDASAATSAVGRHALELLLNKVQTSQKRQRKKNTATKRKRKDASVMENQSTVSSTVGPGKAALDALLGKATTSMPRQRKVSWKKRNTQPSKKQAKDTATLDDASQSIASSIEPGKAALHALLDTAKRKPARVRTRKSPPNAQPPQDQTEQSHVEQSAGSSIGPGAAAMDALLNNAKHNNDPSDASQSIASSVGPGKAALSALLSKANKESGGIRAKKPPPSSHQAQDQLDEDDTGHSTASSTGQGVAALVALRDNVVQTNPRRGKKSVQNKPQADGNDQHLLATPSGGTAKAPSDARRRSARVKKAQSQSEPGVDDPVDQSDENQSTASSRGPGRVALDALLGMANQRPSRKKKRR